MRIAMLLPDDAGTIGPDTRKPSNLAYPVYTHTH